MMFIEKGEEFVLRVKHWSDELHHRLIDAPRSDAWKEAFACVGRDRRYIADWFLWER